MAGAGEGARQFLSGLTGGPRRSIGESAQGVLREAATESVGQGLGRALPGVARLLGRIGRAATIRGGQLTTSVSPESIERVFERGAPQVITPEYQAFAKGGVPLQIQEKVIQGFEKFRTGAEDAYEQALKGLKPQIQGTVTNLSSALKRFQSRLVDAGFLTEEGKTIAPLLGKKTVPEVASSNQQLFSILKQVERLAVRGSGTLPTEQAIRLKRELDTLLDFDPNAVRKMTKPAQSVLLSLRTALKEAVEEAVPELASINDRYHLFRDLYDIIQPRLRDPALETTLRGLTTNRNTFNFRMLEEVNQALKPEERFLNQTLDFLAGSEFGKNPEPFRFLPFSIAGGLSGFMGGGPIGSAVGMLAGAEATSPRAFGFGLKMADRLARPAIQAGRRVQSGLPRVAPFSLRAMQSQEEQN